MQQVPLGKTGVQVSAICLGCMFFGTRIPKEIAYQLLDDYVEAGGCFVDTANNYAFWVEGATGDESETLLGNWMKERRNRDQIFVATKMGARPTVPGGGLDQAEGLSARTIIKAIEGSLKRLQTDHIDLYYTHMEDRATPLEETLEALDRLVREGKVSMLGCSNRMTWRIEEARQVSRAHQWAEFQCVQQRYSYLRPKPGADFGVQLCVNDELLDYCRVHADFSLLAYSPLLSGSYTRNDVELPAQYVGPDTQRRLQVLTEVAEEVEATRNQVVLAWMLQGSPRVIPISAASKSEQLRENLGALELRLSAEQLERLNAASA
ncbi:aryl-alcohol dehydrogenase-like predicted oxidoreductase [Thermosporothrix hazakensis]|uniref:Aryl-alcohol dehydrogenase-like predicted oxidoreductase n=1 Tax=Thermosporothrix hazakensis TaxID=644383 RepID=A0A326UI82_THEHA|nr:aldo/keto reductase [Thermosporothrix hazakensis]PZW31938.1 aryl-alcohol dehydrogenase-like predicted oxidoreductase [Thermosporothrix hazakensis]GCE49737.1 aldo/keto reductase [Thermosporothrix hazakensis]